MLVHNSQCVLVTVLYHYCYYYYSIMHEMYTEYLLFSRVYEHLRVCFSQKEKATGTDWSSFILNWLGSKLKDKSVPDSQIQGLLWFALIVHTDFCLPKSEVVWFIPLVSQKKKKFFFFCNRLYYATQTPISGLKDLVPQLVGMPPSNIPQLSVPENYTQLAKDNHLNQRITFFPV